MPAFPCSRWLQHWFWAQGFQLLKILNLLFASICTRFDVALYGLSFYQLGQSHLSLSLASYDQYLNRISEVVASEWHSWIDIFGAEIHELPWSACMLACHHILHSIAIDGKMQVGIYYQLHMKKCHLQIVSSARVEAVLTLILPVDREFTILEDEPSKSKAITAFWSVCQVVYFFRKMSLKHAEPIGHAEYVLGGWRHLFGLTPPRFEDDKCIS